MGRLPQSRAAAALVVLLHSVLTWSCWVAWSSSPVLLVPMSADVYSRAQVYWDAGAGMSEPQSSSAPVRPSATPQILRLPLPRARITTLRFDPLINPGTVVVGSMTVLRANGSTALTIPPSSLRGVLGFDRMEVLSSGVRYRVRSDSYDPQFMLDLRSPIDLRSSGLGTSLFLRLLLVNAALFALEALLVFWAPARQRFVFLIRSLDRWAEALAARLNREQFLHFDRWAIWFYLSCATLFVIFTLADWNGSSMGVFWRNYKVGAPARIVAGSVQQIRADEFNYETPGMLNQCFRDRKFDIATSALGAHGVALLGSLPARHISTWARPQYWPFFLLPADLAFSAWWQAKWVIFLTGVFTLFLLLTRSSLLALTGAAWLYFSQFTQWCYSWPSMLPEMAGLLCFSVVLACYLTVGASRVALALTSVACAVCAIDFALFSYVPHLIPYAWAGAFLFAAWCFAHRSRIVRAEERTRRLVAGVGCSLLVGITLGSVYRDAHSAIAGIAATAYPGRRSLAGGAYPPAAFGTHFLAPFENDTRFPPPYSNICEASGFLWLAPITLLCFAQMRALPRARRILLAGLWLAALLLAAWMLLPIPPGLGRLMFLDRVMGVRMVPALGLLNAAIVMVVLSAPDSPRRLGLQSKLFLAVPAMLLVLSAANGAVNGYFHPAEILLGALWAGLLSALLWDGRKILFAVTAVVPNLLLFGLINPVERGIDTITSSPLFEVVQKNRDLLRGKWLIFSDGFPAAIFTAVGCEVYNGAKYLPDIDHFSLFAAHGLDTKLINNLGYVDIEELPPDSPARVRKGPYGIIMGFSPTDPLIRELGIRYLAFHKRPAASVSARLEPLVEGTVSEFWLYRIR